MTLEIPRLRTARVRPAFAFAALLTLACATPAAGQVFERRVTKLAEGVYSIEHRNAHDGGAGGNTTVIIGDRQVFVVDAPFLPAQAREDIAQIRTWTDKPVAFLLTTHFHNDHNYSSRVYMDAFPGMTFIAHRETKEDMDRFGATSVGRFAVTTAKYQKILDDGKMPDGHVLTGDEKTEVRDFLAARKKMTDDLNSVTFLTATMTFDHDFEVDLGHRVVDVKFLGRGNTGGDAVVYLPAEKIVAVGDLLVHPLPYFYDGYPREWVHALEALGHLGGTTIVPGHGPVFHDQAYLDLVHDFIKSAVDQVNTALEKLGGPALSHTVDEVQGRVDLSSFKARFVGSDAQLGQQFDKDAIDLVALVFREAALR